MALGLAPAAQRAPRRIKACPLHKLPLFELQIRVALHVAHVLGVLHRVSLWSLVVLDRVRVLRLKLGG